MNLLVRECEYKDVLRGVLLIE